MKTFIEHLNESKSIIEPSTIPNTISLWHGGNLDSAYDETISHKKGRFEYGPGLYLITHYQTAQKYSKGSRKLYMITIKKGNDANDTNIPLKNVIEFIEDYVTKSKRKEVLMTLQKYKDKSEVPAYVFNNIMVNYDAIKPAQTNAMRNFMVANGVDYLTVSNPFGWGNALMVVLFDMKMIVDKKVVGPRDEIKEFDLPPKFVDTKKPTK